MYSWKAIRSWCLLLLLLPLVHFAYLVSREMLAILDPSPTTWAEEMEQYIQSDQTATLPEDPVLVVGGRRVKLWQRLDGLLAPRPVLMRGLGDATVDDISYYYERLVGFYRPATLVVLPDNSEFHIRDHKMAEELVASIKSLEAKAAYNQENLRFIVFTPLKTPLHPDDDPVIEEATRQLTRWAESQQRISVLDANKLLSGVDGRPLPDYFRGDGVQLNDMGYLRLGILLQDELQRDSGAVEAAAGGS